MNREVVIALARQIWGQTAILPTDELLRFAALVAAHEREECAKVADQQSGARKALEHYATLTYRAAAHDCAAAIRSRT